MHFHFILWAAMGKNDNGFTESTEVDVIAPDEKTAIQKAKKIAPGRKWYFVRSIVEHEEHK